MADWRAIVKSVAPALATALAGPLAGSAVSAIGNVLLGNPKATETEVANALAGTVDPEMLLKLRQADQAYSEQMAGLGVRLEELEAADRASARLREATVKDWVPGVLAVSLNISFFGLLALVFVHPIPDQSKDAFNILLGMLGTGTASVWGYYFGSSSGSRAKDAIIDRALKP